MSFRVLTQRNADWVSNAYLVVDPETNHAAFIDCGDPVDHLLAVIADEGLTLERVLLTHHHGDHISGLGHILEAYPGTTVQAHAAESNEMMGVSETMLPGDLTNIGNLEITALGTPGHTEGMLSFLVRPADGDEGTEAVFTGDTLFKASVGSLSEPGATTFEELRHSVVNVLLELQPETVVYPGHEDPTTIAAERHENPFVQYWLGRRPALDQAATVVDPRDASAVPRAATILVWAEDFDGGHKAQVRYADDGTDDLVPGSWVRPA